MPCIIAAPIPPPIACSIPNALETIISITFGNSVIFNIIIIVAIVTYPTAIIGTMMLLTLAMLCIPPNMITTVNIVRIIPTIAGLKLNAFPSAALSVLLCTELNANPKVRMVNMANATDNHFILSPISI